MSDKKITIEFDADLVERHSLVKDRMYFLEKKVLLVDGAVF